MNRDEIIRELQAQGIDGDWEQMTTTEGVDGRLHVMVPSLKPLLYGNDIPRKSVKEMLTPEEYERWKNLPDEEKAFQA